LPTKLLAKENDFLSLSIQNFFIHTCPKKNKESSLCIRFYSLN